MGRGRSGIGIKESTMASQPPMNSREWMENAERQYWEKIGNTVSETSKDDLSYSLNTLLYGARYDREYPKESSEEVELRKDLEYLQKAKTRTEYIKRAESIETKWDNVIKNDPDYSDGTTHGLIPSWWNAYSFLKPSLEREKSDKKQYDKYTKKKRK